jgi:hypothetical protein
MDKRLPMGLPSGFSPNYELVPNLNLNLKLLSQYCTQCRARASCSINLGLVASVEQKNPFYHTALGIAERISLNRSQENNRHRMFCTEYKDPQLPLIGVNPVNPDYHLPLIEEVSRIEDLSPHQ